MVAFLMANSALILGALVLILGGASILLHMAHADKIAALDDKLVAILKQIGAQPPQV